MNAKLVVEAKHNKSTITDHVNKEGGGRPEWGKDENQTGTHRSGRQLTFGMN